MATETHVCVFDRPAHHPGDSYPLGHGAVAVYGDGDLPGVRECACGLWQGSDGEIMLGNSDETLRRIAEARARAGEAS